MHTICTFVHVCVCVGTYLKNTKTNVNNVIVLCSTTQNIRVVVNEYTHIYSNFQFQLRYRVVTVSHGKDSGVCTLGVTS